jgi:hypothetical protein
MAPGPSRSYRREVLGDVWEAIAAATRRSNRQPTQDSPLCSVGRRQIVFRDTNVPHPISRGFQRGAVGTQVSGHDVSGAGWQTQGRVTQPMTTMMPA